MIPLNKEATKRLEDIFGVSNPMDIIGRGYQFVCDETNEMIFGTIVSLEIKNNSVVLYPSRAYLNLHCEEVRYFSLSNCLEYAYADNGVAPRSLRGKFFLL